MRCSLMHWSVALTVVIVALVLKFFTKDTTSNAAILTVLHDDYRDKGLDAIAARLHPEYPLLLDVKGAFRPEDAASLTRRDPAGRRGA